MSLRSEVKRLEKTLQDILSYQNDSPELTVNYMRNIAERALHPADGDHWKEKFREWGERKVSGSGCEDQYTELSVEELYEMFAARFNAEN